MNSLRLVSVVLLVTVCFAATTAAAEPLAQDWDYAAAMKRVAAKFKGKEGVVLHIRDSITYANPYGQWARSGEGQSADDKAVLAWMHLGVNDETDGWYLARFDHPSGGRSHTAAGGMRWNELLAGGKAGLPSLAELLKVYQPQMVVLMMGTNDASAGRKVEDVSRDAETAIKSILGNGTICILSTIPPHIGSPERSKIYNEALRAVAKKYELPLIDYEREILKRRPDDWSGTLLNANDVHPTAGTDTIKASSAPTDENLASSGYLLRGWLSVKKIGEVKGKVIDP